MTPSNFAISGFAKWVNTTKNDYFVENASIIVIYVPFRTIYTWLTL